MRNVSRGPVPESLRKNATKWTKELLDAITESKKTSKKVPDKYYNRYKKDDVKTALLSMYGDGDFCYCCYCESIVDDVSFEHIEHRMPKNQTKDKYPKKTFDWENLHLSCEKCNNHKGTDFDEQHPILDATRDPIKEHLGYKVSFSGKGVYRETITDEGITTVKHADLDRHTLRMARLKVYHATVETIKEITRLGDDPRTYTQIRMLRDKTKEEHGSLIEYMLDEWNIGTID